ncbi:MAG: hypothetical protein BGP06_15835 [Rhizobiales bacterium 65-9]|nr:pyridoxal phosphate-dependent aminotransferase [Hyphomicrobiales bacterium]OJY37951.1 MAG: hypothetical protein BGP06_15835 [Rhizobiales bacterium 65-9]
MTLVRPAIEALEDSPILEVWRMGFTVDGVIGLWAGEPDVPTPRFICEAAEKALAEGHTFYTHGRGIPELRAVLAAYLKRLYGKEVSDDRIAVTSAGMNAVQLVSQALIDPGDKAVVITPSWPNIMRAMQISGAVVTEVPLTSGDNGWSLDLDAVFAAAGPGTKIIYLATPANPTGWMIPPEQARALLDFARARNIAILSDEVYHRIVYDRPVAFSFLDIAEENDPVFIVNSFSKSWAMTGWRMGWLIYPKGLTDTFEKLIQFNTSGGQAFLQYGGVAAVRDGEPFVAEFVERCRRGREIVNAALAKMNRVRNIPNNGSFYAMFEIDGVDDTIAFCKQAVTDARVGLAPGIAFGAGAEKMIRLCYAKSPENLNEAASRLGRFIQSL